MSQAEPLPGAEVVGRSTCTGLMVLLPRIAKMAERSKEKEMEHRISGGSRIFKRGFLKVGVAE